MIGLNLEFLLESSNEYILGNLKKLFEKLVGEIIPYINSFKKLPEITPVVQNVNFELVDTNFGSTGNFINFGVQKIYSNNSLTIAINKNLVRFIRIILLREAYKCFIPMNLQENQGINEFINTKVELELEKAPAIEDWKKLREDTVVYPDYIASDYHRLSGFLKLEGAEDRPSAFQYFFAYIRQFAGLEGDFKEIRYESKSFYDTIWEKYNNEYRTYTEQDLETIRILIEIFYKVKSYHSILEYKDLFGEFKKQGIIQTGISARQFEGSLRWLYEFDTELAPSYNINWQALNIGTVHYIVRFHPSLETTKVSRIMQDFPFALSPRISRDGFGVEVSCYLLIPEQYFKDVVHFMSGLESKGYIIKKKISRYHKFRVTRNLNAFSTKSPLLNPKKKYYRKEFEIECEMSYGPSKRPIEFFDWVLIEKSRQVSASGLGLERKNELLSDIKKEISQEITSQRNLIEEVIENLHRVYNSQYLSQKLIKIINENQRFGSFYITKMMSNYVSILKQIRDIMVENPSLKNYYHFQEFLNNRGISKVLEENTIFESLDKKVISNFVSLKTKPKMDKEIDDYEYLYKTLKSFQDIKTFGLEDIKKAITDKTQIDKIYEVKTDKLKRYYNQYKNRITYPFIEEKLDTYLNNIPPIIYPSVLSTMRLNFSSGYITIQALISDTTHSRNRIESLQWYFPHLSILYSENYFTLIIFANFLSIQERGLLVSIFQNIFNKDLLALRFPKRPFFVQNFTRKDFYDFETKNFLYTKNLFEEFTKFAERMLEKEVEPISEKKSDILQNFWTGSKFMTHLIGRVENRISHERIELNYIKLQELCDYHNTLRQNLLIEKTFQYDKSKDFFTTYIKVINFIPLFQKFGFGKYYLYFYPTNLDDIDFKHFLHNAFQSIKYPAQIDTSSPIFTSFLWPYRNPNVKSLNWLRESKKVIREYCLFFVKKIYFLFQFTTNIKPEEWDMNADKFKIHLQNVLFDPSYDTDISKIKSVNIGELAISDYFSPESKEYEELTKIYNWKTLDIKSCLWRTNKSSTIISLLEKNLIYPYLTLKNLGFLEEIYIILPKVKKENMNKLVKIFSFFNYGFIYEIEGEFFIKGFPENDPVKFENGLMIKLYLPECLVFEFERYFNSLFEYLKIKHHVFLENLIEGKELLNSIYGKKELPMEYNPLKNLKWSRRDKRWMNNKLYTKDFEKIYYELKNSYNKESQ